MLLPPDFACWTFSCRTNERVRKRKKKKDEGRRTGSGTGDDREGATGQAREQAGWAAAGRVLDKVKCRPRVAGGLTES